MSGMIIPGVAVFGGVFDQVVTWDFVINVLFGNTVLAWPAQIVTWLSVVITMYVGLRWCARKLDTTCDRIERWVTALHRTCIDKFWAKVEERALRVQRFAASKRA